MLCPLCGRRDCSCEWVVWVFLVLLIGCSGAPLDERVKVLDKEIEGLRAERAAAIETEFVFKDLIGKLSELEAKKRSGKELPFDRDAIVKWQEATVEYASAISDLIRAKEKERSKLVHEQMGGDNE